MARTETRFCGGFVRLSIALLFAGILDTVVAVSYLVSIASLYSKDSVNHHVSATELTMRCFVPILSFTAVFLLSLGMMTKLAWLLVFHMAKSILLASALGLKAILDIYDIVRTQRFELYEGTATILMTVYVLTEVWFFFVVRKAYVKMVKSERRSAEDMQRMIIEETVAELKPIALSTRSRSYENHRLHRTIMAHLPASSRSHPNCYYEIPIHTNAAMVRPVEIVNVDVATMVPEIVIVDETDGNPLKKSDICEKLETEHEKKPLASRTGTAHSV